MISKILRVALMAAGVCAPLLWSAAPSRAQEGANAAAFWLQEESRAERHVRPPAASRQPTRVRRLVPNVKLARPTIWRAPERAHEAVTPTPETPHDAAVPAAPSTPVAAPDAPETTPPTAAPGAPSPPETRSADAAPAPTPPAATPPTAMSVLVVGDNLGYWLGQGLADAQADAPAETRLTIVRKTKDSSGLVRDDFYDWQKNLREILKGPERFGAVAVMLGSNDRAPSQELRDSAGRYDPLSPRWRELYAARIDAFIAQVKERNFPVVWVGLPIMRVERYSSDIRELNEIYRARVEAAGAKFVDIWDAFADENGAFSVFGPDVNGQIVKQRTSDGIHFTKAGARKLAFFVEQAMRPLLDRQKGLPAPAVATAPPPPAGSAPGAAPAQPQAPATTTAALTPGPSAPPQAPPVVPAAPPPPPPKPLAGPILPLTAPALAPGGELLGASLARTGVAPDLAEGRAAPAQPGRADDFSWPRR